MKQYAHSNETLYTKPIYEYLKGYNTILPEVQNTILNIIIEHSNTHQGTGNYHIPNRTFTGHHNPRWIVNTQSIILQVIYTSYRIMISIGPDSITVEHNRNDLDFKMITIPYETFNTDLLTKAIQEVIL